MMYYVNGGFNWHDIYNMPIRLREFYWKELIKTKEEEAEAMKKSAQASSSKSNSKVIRRR